MSEDSQAPQAEPKKSRESKKASIPNGVIEELARGLPSYEKASFVVIGHRSGVRIALPKTVGVSRAYFYGNGDYGLVPSHPAIRVFSESDRQAARLGGIMAEVSFELGVDAAIEALGLLIAVVRSAPPPAQKGATGPKGPRPARKAKARPEPEQATEDLSTEPGPGVAGGDPGGT